MRWTLLLLVLSAPVLAQGGPPATRVAIDRVTVEEIAEGRTFVGTITAERTTIVGSETDGLVAEMLVNEGDRVEKGQPIAKLRTRLAELRLAGANALLRVREETLRERKNGSRPEEIAQAKARVAKADAEHETRLYQLKSAERLFESGTITEDEVKLARLAANAAEAALNEQRSGLALWKAGVREERILQASAQLEVTRAEAALLEEELARHTVRAPFAGYVVKKSSELGRWVAQGDPVVEIAALDQVDVVTHVPEGSIRHLRVGMKVGVTVAAVGAKPLEGTIVRIVPRADRRARTFPVKIRLQNTRTGKSVLLKDGMVARVTMAIGQKVRATLVPKDAITLGGPTPSLWLIDEQKSMATPMPVQLGISVGDRIQVKAAGLKEGQAVVVRGNERIFMPGPVQITNSGSGKAKPAGD
ncbi:MAG: efflux RND transporter periplasmic adaptor subunit [Planctomycetota bacterium]